MIILRFGYRSDSVRELQIHLNRQGASLASDGLFDAATQSAVRAYQLKVGLVADGIAGPKTLSSLSGADCTKLLKHVDLREAATRLGLPLATVYAVNEIESRGRGFLDNGKPVVLFERHIMYRQLTARPHDQFRTLVLKRTADELAVLHPNIVSPTPGGYVGGNGEHQRLTKARQIDDSAALESTSWGAFQIMGFHWRRLGHNSVQAFVASMETNESQQFRAFVTFLQTDNELHRALRAGRWADFARIYNGPQYARSRYHLRLKEAFERYSTCTCEFEAA